MESWVGAEEETRAQEKSEGKSHRRGAKKHDLGGNDGALPDSVGHLRKHSLTSCNPMILCNLIS